MSWPSPAPSGIRTRRVGCPHRRGRRVPDVSDCPDHGAAAGDHSPASACWTSPVATAASRAGWPRLARRGRRRLSPRFIELARPRTTENADRIHITSPMRPTSPVAGAGRRGGVAFDAAVCTMGMMDMPAVDPLCRASPESCSAPGGRFVFSVMHPCFNGLSFAMQATQSDYADTPVYAISVSRYLSPEVTKGLAIMDRPLQTMLLAPPACAVQQRLRRRAGHGPSGGAGHHRRGAGQKSVQLGQLRSAAAAVRPVAPSRQRNTPLTTAQ